MPGHILAAIIMFLITVVFTGLFFFPAKRFKMKTPLVNFYWRGFWIFLAFIAAFAGAQNILLVMGLDTEQISVSILTGISAAFIVFVVFAWVRLAFKAMGKALSQA